jgi:ELWxxDGT repeat protein
MASSSSSILLRTRSTTLLMLAFMLAFAHVVRADDPPDAELFMDLSPGAQSSNVAWGPELEYPWDDRRFFVAETATTGRELHILERSGPRLVLDIYPGTTSGVSSVDMAHVQKPSSNDSFVIFAARIPNKGFELFRSDGTEAGTYLVKDILPGPGSSAPSSFVVVSNLNLVYFVASTGGSDRELWRTDGTAAGTWRVVDLRPGPVGSNPRLSASWQTGLDAFFFADDGVHGVELFRVGVSGEVVLVRDLYEGPLSGVVFSPTDADEDIAIESGHNLVVRGRTPQTGTELFIAGKTTTGAFMQLLGEVVPGPESSNPHAMTLAGASLFFAATHPTLGTELFTLSAEGARAVYDRPGGSGSPRSVTTVGRSAFFIASDATGNEALFFTERGMEGSVQLTPTDLPHVFGGEIIDHDSLAFFEMDGELWRSTGTPHGTKVAARATHGAPALAPHSMVSVARTFFFSARTTAAGDELWRWQLSPLLAWVRARQPTDPIYTPAPHDQFNSVGAPNTIERLSVGRYLVLLPYLQVERGGNVQVTAKGDADVVCNTVGWWQEDTFPRHDEGFEVRCYARTGESVDSEFEATFFAARHESNDVVYMETMSVSGDSIFPLDPWPPGSEETIEITRFAPGQYLVLLEGHTEFGGHVQVTAVSDYDVSCTVALFDEIAEGKRVFVQCERMSGDFTDAPFSLRYAFGHTPGRHGAYVYAHDPEAPSYTPYAHFRYNSTGQPVTITRLSEGEYRVNISGIVRARTVVEITPLTWWNNRCSVLSTRGDIEATHVRVRCVQEDGARDDTPFFLSLVAHDGMPH